jgi:tetratricopeptide (TPR) repeat protein
MRSGSPEKPLQAKKGKSDVPPKGQPEPKGAKPVLPQPGDLARADELIRGSWYDAALTIYQPLSATAAPPLRDTLIYRVALCLEGLGRWDEALAAYRQTASRTDAPRSAAAGQLGQARVYLRMRRLADAKVLLCDLLLRSAQPALREQSLLAYAQYLLALALAFEATQGPPDLLRSTPVSHTGTDWPLEDAVDWVGPGRAREAGDEEPKKEFLRVQPPGSGAAGATVSAALRGTSVTEFLERLARESGLKPHWTPRAKELAEGRTTTVVLYAVPLADVWRMQADALGLVWKTADGVVTLSTEGEITREELTAQRRAEARRALRGALREYPNHALAPTASLEAGNLEVAENNVKEAVSWYRRLIQEHPRSPVMVEVHYNLALVRQRQGDLDAARQLFFGVVDRAPGHELTPLAYLRIGHLHLEANQPDSAVSPLRRAQTLSAGSPAQPLATLALAVCHLLTDNPRAAAAAILENRNRISAEPYRPFASFLEAYAHYRSIPDQRPSQREAGTLLAALLLLREGAALVPGGEVLVGRAYRDLGMGDRMAAIYEKALASARGPLAGEMTCALAEYLASVGRRADAKRWLTPLAESDQGAWTVQARLQLAEIALKEKRPADSLTWCRKLLAGQGKADVPATLKVMGQAFELAGEHRQAARCYAGMLPD